MDIARYIGLFLLKNKFAYIHGLGNMELVRTSATHDGQALNAPQYDIRLTHGGSIDDTLANFIATHEQTSISKAANALRDFATASRADLAAGKEVIIPTLGKFIEDARGIRFITDPSLDYTPPPIPVLRSAKRLEEVPTWKTESPQTEVRGEHDTPEIAWSKIAIIAALLIALAIGGWYAWRYLQRNNTVKEVPIVKKVDTLKNTSPINTATDTARHAEPVSAAPVQPAGAAGMTTYIIGTYSAKASAEKRIRQLTVIGNKVEMIAKDSATYLVTMAIDNGIDTIRAKDSLRRIFNPKGVNIYR